MRWPLLTKQKWQVPGEEHVGKTLKLTMRPSIKSEMEVSYGGITSGKGIVGTNISYIASEEYAHMRITILGLLTQRTRNV
jgi:hypothetical protein